MSFRLRFFSASLFLICGLPAAFPCVFSLNAAEFSYFPEVVFAGESLTFRLSAPQRNELRVLSETREITRIPLPAGDTVEWSTRLQEGTTLSFYTQRAGEAQGFSVRVLRPAADAGLREVDGFLFQEDTPVILLPDHRLPPRLDRRWETLQHLTRPLHDPRLAPGPLLWLAPGPHIDTSLAAMLTTQPVRQIFFDPEAWFQVHGLIVQPSLPRSEFVVLEVDEADLERGMPLGEWRMKWQFALQQLQARTGYQMGILLGPEASETAAPWLPLLRAELQSLARAHDLIYIDRTQPSALWRERLFNRLSREVRLP